MIEQAFFSFLISVGVLALLAFVLGWIFIPQKSKQYRQVLADMYVAAKIKYLAKKDGLDLVGEFEFYKQWEKKKRLSSSDINLDEAVEIDLKDKIIEPSKGRKKDE